jgi:dTDP-4-amino-4,6-dideoxygalactose transaminase
VVAAAEERLAQSGMNVPLTKPDLGEPELALLSQTIASGWITQGPRVAEFERAFAEYVGARHAVAVSSCTTALHLSLHLLGAGPGDEVITSPHSFIATANAIRYCGARPVFADIEPASLNLAPEAVRAAITPKTKAVLVVHQVGRPADLEALAAVAQERGLPIVEDAACAIGSEYRGAKIGSNRYSSLVCFSFHPRKVITTGDGGMITTDNDAFNERLRRLRQHGMSVNDLQRHRSATVVHEQYLEVGWNYRLTDLQAAVGLAQLHRLPDIIARRRGLAARYDRAFAGVAELETFAEPEQARWNYQSYLVRLKGTTAAQRDAVMQMLLDAGVATRRGIMSIHREPCYVDLCGAQSFPESERASDQCLCLPLYPQMGQSEQDLVVETLLKTLRQEAQ